MRDQACRREHPAEFPQRPAPGGNRSKQHRLPDDALLDLCFPVAQPRHERSTVQASGISESLEFRKHRRRKRNGAARFAELLAAWWYVGANAILRRVCRMRSEAADQLLLTHGIFFLPWIGKNYLHGFHGRRLLVLGESHYDKWEGLTHQLGNEFTRECIQEVVDRESDAEYWKYIEQALLNETREKGWAPNGGNPLWGTLSFYNFLQSPVSGGPRSSLPKWSLIEESRKPFRAVLERLRPDRVLVCSKRLWGAWMEIRQKEDYLHDNIQAYRLADGTQVWCLATDHPSSGRYSWKRLHPLIMTFLDEPQRAAKVLQNS